MATHSSALAWRIPGMGEPGGLPSMGSHGVRHDWSDLAAAVWWWRAQHYSQNAQSSVWTLSLVELVALAHLTLPLSVPHLIRLVTGVLNMTAAAAAKWRQSCPTLCDPIDGSPPGSPVPGILQARTLEWVAISFSNAWKWKVRVKSLSRVRLLATPWTAAYQAPLSMGFSRQEYWSGVPLPSPLNMTYVHILWMIMWSTKHEGWHRGSTQ